jgi:integrase
MAKTGKVTLTDRKVQSLKAAPKGERYQVMDALVPGFGVRVTDGGVKTYIMQARYPGSSNPARRELGRTDVLDLKDARSKAGDWHKLIKQGLDPALVEQRKREEAVKAQANTFAAIFEDYKVRKLETMRSGQRIIARFNTHFIPKLGSMPITEITDIVVLSKIVHPRMKTKGMARQLLNDLRTFFFWMVDQRVYGMKASELAPIRVAALLGKVRKRNRTLGDTELRALWIAANRMPYPVGPLYRMLMQNPLRLREASKTSRSEWDMRSKCWMIPGERMKGKLDHAVPITKEMADIYAYMPNRGDYLFSYDGGEKPMEAGNGTAKKLIDAEMLKALREIAVENGEDPEMVQMKPWTNHDIRRTIRSRLSGLKGVPHEAKEALLAHVKGGVEAVYDVHEPMKYFDEKREALEAWAAALRGIVEPLPSNVVRIRGGRGGSR